MIHFVVNKRYLHRITGESLHLSVHFRVNELARTTLNNDHEVLLAHAANEKETSGDYFQVVRERQRLLVTLLQLLIDEQGYASVRVQLGSGQLTLTHRGLLVDDGQWHTVTVER